MKKITFICFEGFQSLDLTGPLEVFDLAKVADQRHYKSYLLSAAGGKITSSSGLTIYTQTLHSLEGFDAMIVIGCDGSRIAMYEPLLINYIKAQSLNVQRIVSICSGAFLLAKAGLLEHCKVTTHWRCFQQLRQVSSKIILDENAIYLRSGKVYTSAGVTAGMDLALAIVKEDYGRVLSLQIAKELVIYYHRAGGQKQYSNLLQNQSVADDKLAELCRYIQDNLQQDLRVSRLATHMNMSGRNFSRVFTKQMQVSPAKYVEQARLDYACQLLANNSLSMKQIASLAGLSNVEILRRLFHRYFAISTSEYRQRFC